MVKDSDFDAGEALDEDAGKQKGSFGSLRKYRALHELPNDHLTTPNTTTVFSICQCLLVRAVF